MLQFYNVAMLQCCNVCNCDVVQWWGEAEDEVGDFGFNITVRVEWELE